MSSDNNAFSSASYWEMRYRLGGNSGAGSYNRLARFKAEVINAFVAEMGVDSVIEFGAGDGNQLMLYAIPEYIGVDVSMTAVDALRRRFKEDRTKRFFHTGEFSGQTATLALSIDVIFHLVEDDVYDAYMRDLFAAARRYVIIYSSNGEAGSRDAEHVRHRKFTAWVARHMPGWVCTRYVRNKYSVPLTIGNSQDSSFCDFYFYERKPAK